jgi:plasmid stabilization system protein ParE
MARQPWNGESAAVPQVTWTPTALTDVRRHYQRLEPLDLDAALRARDAIRRAGDSLKLHPRRGTIVQKVEGLRKLRVKFGKYGFVLHYAVVADEVVILKVYDGRENRPT